MAIIKTLGNVAVGAVMVGTTVKMMDYAYGMIPKKKRKKKR